jgi:3-hydroxybutyryl-CoA dehydrogenase
MITNVAVIGAGTMGNGIAHLFAQNGFSVNLIDVSETQLENAITIIKKNLDRQIVKSIISEEIKNKTSENISTFTSLKERKQPCDIVVKSATEDKNL